VRLLTTILISPLLPNAVYLAKQAATIDHLSSGRLSLGLAVGGREQDYVLSGLDFHHRGRDLDRQIEVMRSVWRGDLGVGPSTAKPEGPDILIGGGSPEALRRAARNSGWIAGGGAGPDGFRRGADEIREAWQKAGRAGQPRFIAVGLYCLGPYAKENAIRLLTSSYGPERAEVMLPEVPLTADAVREFVSTFSEAGCDEVILTAASQDLDQLDLFAEAISLAKP
jgi:alkanesulfonate monooxygenase SsuD/methylene tetrahydromethanopterin reductase-like flavin-dependent oxidoreductase (luciferase family)